MGKLRISYAIAGLVILAFAGAAMAQTIDTGTTGTIGPTPTLGTCPCTAGDPEGEPDCGLPVDTVNGGCNSTPFMFSPIECGQTICGTLAGENGTRDTDWYELVLAVPDNVTIELTSEVQSDLFTVDLSAAPFCSAPAVINSDIALACGGTATIVEAMAAGSNYIFVSTDGIFDGVPCGTEYTLTVTCDIPVELTGFDVE